MHYSFLIIITHLHSNHHHNHHHQGYYQNHHHSSPPSSCIVLIFDILFSSRLCSQGFFAIRRPLNTATLIRAIVAVLYTVTNVVIAQLVEASGEAQTYTLELEMTDAAWAIPTLTFTSTTTPLYLLFLHVFQQRSDLVQHAAPLYGHEGGCHDNDYQKYSTLHGGCSW